VKQLCQTRDCKKKRKIFPEALGPLGGTDLRFFRGLVHRAVCLFTSQLSLVLTAPTHGWMARLSWSGWLGYIPRRYTRERSSTHGHAFQCRVTS